MFSDRRAQKLIYSGKETSKPPYQFNNKKPKKKINHNKNPYQTECWKRKQKIFSSESNTKNAFNVALNKNYIQSPNVQS